MSESQIKALNILLEHPKINAAAFAKFMWADSNMHKKVSNQGHGATRGKAAWLCGGSYMGKLKKKGLVRDVRYDDYGYILLTSCYELTEKGKELIKEAAKPLKTKKS